MVEKTPKAHFKAFYTDPREEVLMNQFFSRPDRCLTRCGSLSATIVESHIPHAPSFLNGLRALFIADVHVVPSTLDADLQNFAVRLCAMAPDILLLGGDYADTSEQTLRFLNALRAFRPPLGAYAVLGNNDREAWPNLSALERAMSDAGIYLLVNRAKTLRLQGGNLIIAGSDEAKYGEPAVHGLYPEKTAPDIYRLLLFHQPCLPAVMPDLMLSGHTHGGQFNLLGVTPYTIGFERLFRGRRDAVLRIAGMAPLGDGWMLVSKGIGASRIPLRIGVRPEMNLLCFDG